MIATTVGIPTIVSPLIWIFRVERRRRWMWQLAIAALIAVITQGILGGMTVIMLLPWWISSSHATLAQLFFDNGGHGVVYVAALAGRSATIPKTG